MHTSARLRAVERRLARRATEREFMERLPTLIAEIERSMFASLDEEETSEIPNRSITETEKEGISDET